jgi:hypothetical protein
VPPSVALGAGAPAPEAGGAGVGFEVEDAVGAGVPPSSTIVMSSVTLVVHAAVAAHAIMARAATQKRAVVAFDVFMATSPRRINCNLAAIAASGPGCIWRGAEVLEKAGAGGHSVAPSRRRGGEQGVAIRDG